MNELMVHIMENSSTISLSRGISSQEVKIKKQSDGVYTTQSGYKYNHIIIPCAIGLIVSALLFTTEAYLDFGLKNYFGLLLFMLIFGGFIYFLQHFLFQPLVFDFEAMKCYRNDKLLVDLIYIESVQVLVYHHQISGNNRIRFEINLVPYQGDRIHLYNNTSYILIKEQARFLASEIGCIVRDETYLAY